MQRVLQKDYVKVPEPNLIFWIIKIAATTLGETGGDAVSMSMNLGYLVSSGIFFVFFFAATFIQITTRRFIPIYYWLTIIASTTFGTTLADFADRSLHIGYPGGALLLFILLISCISIWYLSLGSISIGTIRSPKVEIFYWLTITFSQTLGTALGDWTADTIGLGYGWGAIIFGSTLVIVAALYFFTKISRTLLFWLAFILTRPLGAVLGDFFDKPLNAGGLAMSRYSASLILITFIILMILLLPQRAAANNRH